MEQQTGGNTDRTGDQKAAHRNARLERTKPTAGNQPQDHSSESWGEAQRQIAAPVVSPWLASWEQIQEPLIESCTEIAVLVPVGSKPE